MLAERRSYRFPDDYEDVGKFLVRSYALTVNGPHRNWLQPRWEYMHYHPEIYEMEADLARCRLWFADGDIVGAVHFESRLGIVYLQLDPAYADLKAEMLRHAEESLFGEFKIGKALHVYLDDDDTEWQAIASSLGFAKLARDQAEVTSCLRSDDLPDEIPVPKGFEILGLDEDDDVRKVHRVMHRGFNHEGEPPEDGLEDRRRKLSAPNLRKDLTVVAREPNGAFVSFCGMWMDPTNRVSYVEPVATDPDYRRLGLGTAVVLEGVRRCAAEGAKVAYVGSDQEFYKTMGFTECQVQSLWRKALPS